MTHKSAIKLLEGYYGDYERDLTKRMIYDYLQEQFTEDELEIIMDRIIKGYSGQFRFTPDIDIIEKFKEEYNEEHSTLIGDRRKQLRITEDMERPGDGQKAEVADMLSELVEKLDHARHETSVISDNER